MARLALAVLLVVVSALPVRTQAVHPAVTELLTKWVAAVQSHTPGAMDDAVVSIAAWNRSELLLAQPFVRAMVDALGLRWRSRRLKRDNLSLSDAAAVADIAPRLTTEAGVNDFIKRAALLHTDAVLLADHLPEIAPPPQLRSRSALVIARGPDGRFANFEYGSLHWEYARALLDAVTPSPETDTTVALWYRAVMASYASSYSFGEALLHVNRARQLFPNDPGVLFGDAAIQETLASPRIQDYVRVTTLPMGSVFLLVTSEREHLDLAEARFRRALQRDPTLWEGWVRLARVVSQRGRHEEALSILREGPPQGEAVLSFYAHMIRGDVERSLKRHDAAQASYQQALDLFPSAQSARLALGYLARLRADRDGARTLVQPALTAPVPRHDDPWWEYHEGDGRNAEELFRRLRAPFLVKAPQ